ncbi:PTS sugar transporter subunit IIA [Olsenella sp. Marseille-P4559]|uniref:PTS sugar transporter subunit IIA n=1 Tax=Olsenella sp. Marseille-P4559 TaxID=2364795 RepID=UPI00103025D1|nr:PTS fructose transporter subunit IIA [Olsenella sp. Marseille-P4559]
MRYLLLVSHGTLAPGISSVLDMLVGHHDNVLVCNMPDGMGADAFVAGLKGVLAPVTTKDELVVFGDVIGGSPLTNTMNVITEKGLLPITHAFGGMNLPMAITAVMGDDVPTDELLKQVVDEGQASIRELELDLGSDDDEEDL